MPWRAPTFEIYNVLQLATYKERSIKGYTDLVKKGADVTDMREYLVDGETFAVTICIPANLRDSAKEEAVLRGSAFSALVRECVIDELSKGRK